jgi:hypothetical protein
MTRTTGKAGPIAWPARGLATGLLVAILSTFTAALPVIAQESENRVAVETDWSVFVEPAQGECWAVSAPKETVNTRDGRVVAVRRGDTLLFVTYRRGSATPEVSFTGGYPFASGTTVQVRVGTDTFQLFSEGDWAWAGTPADDARLIDAMRRGAEAVVTGTSSRGTNTTDTFSLFGFTAATQEAQRRCAS